MRYNDVTLKKCQSPHLKCNDIILAIHIEMVLSDLMRWDLLRLVNNVDNVDNVDNVNSFWFFLPAALQAQATGQLTHQPEKYHNVYPVNSVKPRLIYHIIHIMASVIEGVRQKIWKWCKWCHLKLCYIRLNNALYHCLFCLEYKLPTSARKLVKVGFTT